MIVWKLYQFNNHKLKTMNTKNFLTTEQVENLTEREWNVSPVGKYLTLYRDDFHHKAWEEVCQQLNAQYNADSIDILYFGTQINL